jgi:hypothetical protein
MCFIAAYGVQCLGCWLSGSGAGQQAVSPERGMLHDGVVQHPSSGLTACCPAPDPQQPATKALHTIGGNKTHIVSSS